MADSSRALLLDRDPRSVEELLAPLRAAGFEVTPRQRLRDVLRDLRRWAPCPIFVHAPDEPAAVERLVEGLRRRVRQRGGWLVVATRVHDAERLAGLMRAGADDLLSLPVTADDLALRLPVIARQIARREMARSSEERWHSVMQSAAEFILDLERDGTIRRIDRGVPGLDPGEAVGRSIYSHLPESSHAVLREAVSRIFAGGGTQSFELAAPGDGGEPSWYSCRAGALTRGGRIVAVTVAATDSTERRRARQALEASEERFRSLVQNSSDMIAILDADLKVLYASPSLRRFLGYDPEERVGRSGLEHIHPKDAEQLSALFAELRGKPGESFTSEHRVRHRDGRWRVLETTATNLLENPAVGGIVINARDVTERKVAERQILHGALHDALTGLPNRALLMDRLERATQHFRRDVSRPFAVLFFDLDRFKLVNESLGHAVGDQLLVEVSKILQGCLRPTDTVARLGGDDFVLLIEDIHGTGDALGVAGRIHELLEHPITVAGHEVFVTASIGVVLSRPGHDAPLNLLRDADIAMYRAKARGGACHVVFGQTMHGVAHQRLALETDLRRAVEREEFEVFYQPIVSLEEGQLFGFEALVRWRHRRRGLLSPGEFLAVAEETGLILPLGELIFEQACRQLRRWRDLPAAGARPLISVNLSNKQFFQVNLLEVVQDTLERWDLHPGDLALEVTEGVAMDHEEAARRRFSALKEMGARLFLDDFGTGYSSLSYLKHLPIDTLKVDRSFLADVGQGPKGREILRGIISLGRSLGLEVIGEGVEGSHQLQELRALECPYGQGLLFAPPLPAQKATAMLLAQHHLGHAV